MGTGFAPKDPGNDIVDFLGLRLALINTIEKVRVVDRIKSMFSVMFTASIGFH